MKKYFTLFVLLLTSCLCGESEDCQRVFGKDLPIEGNNIELSEVLLTKAFIGRPAVDPDLEDLLVQRITSAQHGLICLSDGSTWMPFYGCGRKEVKNKWQTGDEILICYTPSNFFFPPVVAYNLTKKLSVYALLAYAPKPNAPDAVKISSISLEDQNILTNKEAIISFNNDFSGIESPFWRNKILYEFAEGDVLSLMVPEKNPAGESIVWVWNHRLGSLIKAEVYRTIAD